MPTILTVTSGFAKSSVILSTLFYILTNREIRSKLFLKTRFNSIPIIKIMPSQSISSYITNYYDGRNIETNKNSQLVIEKQTDNDDFKFESTV